MKPEAFLCGAIALCFIGVGGAMMLFASATARLAASYSRHMNSVYPWFKGYHGWVAEMYERRPWFCRALSFLAGALLLTLGLLALVGC
jgi:hypothetical protein